MGFCGGCLLAFVAIFLPPLPVLWRTGCSADFIINILLTCLAWLPGVIHAWYVISTSPDLHQKHHYEARQRHYQQTPGPAYYGPPATLAHTSYPPQEAGYVKRGY